MLYLCVCPSVFAPAWFVLPLRVCSAFLFCMCFALRPCFAFTQTWHAFLFLIYWYTPTLLAKIPCVFLGKMRLGFIIHACECIHVMWPTAAGFPCFFEGKLCPAITSTCAAGNKFTRKPLHTEAVTHRSLYTDKCYTKYLWGKKLLDTGTFAKAFANRNHYTHRKSLHTEAFTHRNLYTNTEEFTHRSRLHRNLCTEKLLHEKPLQKELFGQRNLYRRKRLQTKTITRTETFTRRNRYTQKPSERNLLHKETFAERKF